MWRSRFCSRRRPRPGQDDGKRRLALEDYLSWETVDDPQISPDGETVVYERRFVDALADRIRTELWVIGADGARNRFLTEGGGATLVARRHAHRVHAIRQARRGRRSSSAGWTPKARRAASPGWRNPPSQIRWAPDSGSLAFRAVVSPAPAPAWSIEMPRAPDGADWTAPARIVTRLNYRRDGSGYVPAGYRHIFVVGADGGTPRQVTGGDFHHDDPRFTPDGKGIVFSGLREPDAEYAWRESEVYRVDLATRAISALTGRDGTGRQRPPPPPTGAPSPTPGWTRPPTPTARRAST